MRNSFSSTGGRVVVGGSRGFDVDGAMKLSVVEVEPATVVEGATDVDVGEGAADGDPEPVLLGPQLTSPIARSTVATSRMTLRTGTSGGGSAVPNGECGVASGESQ